MIVYEDLIDIAEKKNLMSPMTHRPKGASASFAFKNKQYLYREDYLFDNHILRAVFEIKNANDYNLLTDRQVKNLLTKIKEDKND